MLFFFWKWSHIKRVPCIVFFLILKMNLIISFMFWVLKLDVKFKIWCVDLHIAQFHLNFPKDWEERPRELRTFYWNVALFKFRNSCGCCNSVQCLFMTWIFYGNIFSLHDRSLNFNMTLEIEERICQLVESREVTNFFLLLLLFSLA